MENSFSSKHFYLKMNERRSIRAFSSESIPRETVENAIKTAGTSPSGANRQPWFFAIIESQEIKDQIRMAAEEVEDSFYKKPGHKQWVQDLKKFGTNPQKPYLSEAPILIAVFSRTRVIEDGAEVKTYYPNESVGIATGMLITTLHLAGLATLTHTPKPMSFLNKVLNLDCSYRPFMIIVTGYPKIPLTLPEIHRKKFEEISRRF